MQNRKSTYKGLIYDWQALQSNFSDETQCYELSGKQIALLMYPFRQAFWNTRWENQPENFREIEQFVNDTLHKLYNGEQCSPIVPSGGGGSSVYMPACITTEDQGDKFVINIEECCDMTVIINIKDCCCDDSIASGGGNNITGQGAFGASGGSSGGGWTTEPQQIAPYSGSISGCEVLTGGVVDYILNDQQDFLVGLSNSGGTIANIIDFFATYNPIGVVTSDGVDWATDQAVDTLVAAASLWNDQQFRIHAKEMWAKTFGDRQNWKLITRSELLQWAGNIQKIWFQGVYPTAARSTMQGVIRFQNMAKINQQLALAYNECDIEDYQYYLAGAGVPYLPPTNQATLPAPGLGFAYEWGRRYDFLVGTQSFTNSVGGHTVGLGWTGVGGPAEDYRVIIQRSFTCQLTGVRIGLDRSLQGNINEVNIGTSLGGDNILADSQHPAENPIVIALDYAASGNVSFRITENSYSNNADDNFTAYVEHIDLFGTGTPPSGGEEIFS
jgi:hypothetical protein